MSCNKEKEARSIAYTLAEKCLAENLEPTDAVVDYLIVHPLAAAECSVEKLRNLVCDIMTEFDLDD